MKTNQSISNLMLTNLGSVASVPTETGSSTAHEKNVHAQIAAVQVSKNVSERIAHIRTLEQLFTLDVPTASRLELFKQLNAMVGLFMVECLEHDELYQATFEMMTAFKRHLDLRPAFSSEQEEGEYEELEKSIYMLCDWEDGVAPLVTHNS